MMELCYIDGCSNHVRNISRKLCNRHHLKLLKYGDPLGGRKHVRGIDTIQWILDALMYDGDECLLWPYSKSPYGYGQVRIDSKTEYVHVIVATIKLGPKPTPKHVTRHLCGNGNLGCATPGHLCWGTQKENRADCKLHGTENKGTRNGGVILSEEQVMIVLHDDRPMAKIALDYGVTKGAVDGIKSGRTWAWLTGKKLDADLNRPKNRGSRVRTSILSEEQVIEIFNDTSGQNSIALSYGVSKETVSDIKLGRTWSWLTGKQFDETLYRSGNIGSKVRTSILSEDQVMSIKYDTRKQKHIAIHYGVSDMTISDIKRGRTWSHLTGIQRKESPNA